MQIKNITVVNIQSSKNDTGLKFRSSHSEVFCNIGVLRNFAKFTGKHLRQGVFFNKVAG